MNIGHFIRQALLFRSWHFRRILERLAGDEGAGFRFLFRNTCLRLAFLLRVEGLGFFLVLPGISEARPLSLAPREKEKVEPILREKLKAKPWSANVWQRSRHLVAKVE